VGLQELLLRLGAAAALGSLIGLERQRLDKSAGLRTHMLVSVGAALVMIVSAYGFDEVLRPSRVALDPSRVAAQVVSGIGFLGAGTILRRNQAVHGLTTAASIWAVAAVGLAAGGGLYLAATAASLLMLVILAVVKPLEDRILDRGAHRTLHLTSTRELPLTRVETLLHGAGLELVGLRVRSGEQPGERQLEITCGAAAPAKLLAFIESVQSIEGVCEIGYGRES
jgi:putative Mg2+ transporter-C (MgtC) family protein